MESITEEHITAWRTTVIGWGGSRNAIERIANGTHTYATSGNKAATGNGVIMKLCPLGMFYAICYDGQKVLKRNADESDQDFEIRKRDKMCQDIEVYSKLTHDTAVSIVCSCLLGIMADYLYRNTTLLDTKQSRKEVLTWLVTRASDLETKFIHEDEIAKAAEGLSPEDQRKIKDRISPRLKKMLAQFDTLTDDAIIEISDGATYYVIDSLVAVIGILVSRDPSFDSIITAAYMGGDTDSNAAIVGAILAGMKGLHALIPTPYIEQLHGAVDIMETGIEFTAMMKAL